MSLHTVSNIENNSSRKGLNNKALIGLSLGILANLSVILGPGGANANTSDDNLDISTNSGKSISLETTNKGANLLEKITSNKNLKLFRYKIIAGDNLTRIAKKYGTTIPDIINLNPQIIDQDKIIAGAFLNILFDFKIIEGGKNNDVVKKSRKIKTIEPGKFKQKINKQSPETTNTLSLVKTTGNTIFTHQVVSSIIKNEKQINVFHQYARHTHKKDFKKIQDSNLSDIDKNRKIMNLFLTDCNIFGERIVIKQIKKLKFEKGITKKIATIFENIGFNIIPNQIIDLYSKVETSGGAYNDTFEKARKEKDSNKQNLLIVKAVNKAVGPKGDSGPLHITGDWLDTEIKYGASINGKYEKDKNILRKKVFMVFKTAIINRYSQEKVNKVLAKVDVTFDEEQMSNVILGSFTRIHDKYSKMGGLTKLQVVKLCFVAYNRGEGNANIVARRIIRKDPSGLRGLERIDTNKRMSFIKVASLENNLQNNLTTAKANNTENIVVASNYIKTTTGIASTKVINLSDRVKYHTGKIINIKDRKRVEKKLEINPIEKLSRSEQRYKILADKGDESAKNRSIGIRNIIIDLDKYKKVA